ncbi:MAG: xanthine phosphoribosyltransferase [Clostridiales bacterium]|nr:xanthine phosphoribosyltransferase [Clostridiales bacterium]
MEKLKERILRDGVAIGTEIVKVDSFLNHQLDVGFLYELGAEFRRRFADANPEKILTMEASGIPVACMAALHFHNIPVVFAKKAAPSTMTEGVYTANVTSFTKGIISQARVSQKFIRTGERILIIDDFLAHGEAALGLLSLVEQAGARTLGLGVVIEKEFQGGSARVRDKGCRVESLAIIAHINDGVITFK